ncbi:hypothetical protein LMH73_009855 [Vibrio splendidus]|nr:hypothetical protein [Vibrio splendidus]MCC4883042.1 hypothetical protein [Vibrio splendidus]
MSSVSDRMILLRENILLMGRLHGDLLKLLASDDAIHHAPFSAMFFKDSDANPHFYSFDKKSGGIISYSSELHTRFSIGVGLAACAANECVSVLKVLKRLYEHGINEYDPVAKCLMANLGCLHDGSKISARLSVCIDKPLDDENVLSGYPCLIACVDTYGLNAKGDVLSTRELTSFQNATNAFSAMLRLTNPSMPFMQKLGEVAERYQKLELDGGKEAIDELLEMSEKYDLNLHLGAFHLEQAIGNFKTIISMANLLIEQTETQYK